MADEAVVQQLLEEVCNSQLLSFHPITVFFSKKVLGSALHRSLELVLMEASVVEVICDKGG